MKRWAATVPTVDGVPAELTDRDADVWHNDATYRGYMAERGYQLSVSDRLDTLHRSRRHVSRNGDAVRRLRRRFVQRSDWSENSGANMRRYHSARRCLATFARTVLCRLPLECPSCRSP